MSSGRLLGDRILIEPDDRPDEVIVGGIIVPMDASREVTTGIIVDIGPDCSEPSLKIGQRILHSPYSGFLATIGGIHLKILSPHEVFYILAEGESADAQ